MTGMRFTRVPKRFMISMSRGLSLQQRMLSSYTLPVARYHRLRVTRGADEVQASVHPEVNLLLAPRLLLLAHIRLMLIVNEVNNGGPRVAVVHVVAEPGGIDDGKLRLELLLLQLRLDDLNFGELVELFVMTAVVVLGRGQLSREERVDERRLSKTGLAYKDGVYQSGVIQTRQL